MGIILAQTTRSTGSESPSRSAAVGTSEASLMPTVTPEKMKSSRVVKKNV